MGQRTTQKGNFKKNLETSKNGNATCQKYMGCNKREMYSDKYLPKEKRSQVSNRTLHINELEKEEQTKPKINTEKKGNEREEINEIEIRKTLEEKSMKPRSVFF